MTRSIFFAAIFLVACGQNSGDKKTVTDTTRKSTDTTTTTFTKDTAQAGVVPGAAKVNELLKSNNQPGWTVVTDKETGWMKDVFDYFVVPERKMDPDFPFITKGDYDCDGKQDIAAIVTNDGGKQMKIVYFLSDGQKVEWWKEDVQGAAMKNLPKTEVSGFENLDDKGKKIQMKCDGLEVAWFEKSSYVIYRDGKGFSNIWTSD